MLRKLLFICLLILLPGLAFCRAADTVKKTKPKAKAVMVLDTSKVVQRTFDTAALNKYKAQREFIYNGELKGETPWEIFKAWLGRLIERFFSNQGRRSTFSFFLKYLLIIGGACALAFLIFKLIGVDVSNIFRNKPANAGLPYSEFTENIHDINFDEGIEQAVAKHNYRLAVRLSYLKCLKQLTDAGLIHWEINKTNNDYSNELTEFNQRLAFNLLTRQFEYVWYGNFTIDASVYAKVSALFKDFKETIAK
jgi:hypothetical protein